MSALSASVASLLGISMISSAALVSSASESRRQVLWVSPGEFRGVPVAGGDRVFARTSAGEVVALDRRTGRVQWRSRLTTSPGFVAGGRLVVAHQIVVGGDDGLDGFDADTGGRLWSAATESGAGVGIQLGTVAGDDVFAGSYVSRVFAIDVRTGRVRWSADAGFGAEATVFAPRADTTGVVATSTSFRDHIGGVVAFDDDGHFVWRRVMTLGVIGPALLAGDLVMAVDRAGVVHALDRLTGEVRWTIADTRSRAPAEDFRPLVSAGSTLVVGSLTGELIAYDLATRAERWRAWPVQASIAFGLGADEHTVWVPYVSGHVIGLDLATGRQRWRLGDSGEGFRWLPLVRGNDIYLCGADGGLVAVHGREGD